MAKRLGHSGSGRCAPGSSPVQMSELAGLGNLGVSVFWISTIGFH